MPTTAASGANAADIESGGNAAEVVHASSADSIDDRQCVGSVLSSILGLRFAPERGCFRRIAAVAEFRTPILSRCQRRSSPLCNEPTLFLGQRGIEMEHERIGI